MLTSWFAIHDLGSIMAGEVEANSQIGQVTVGRVADDNLDKVQDTPGTKVAVGYRFFDHVPQILNLMNIIIPAADHSAKSATLGLAGNENRDTVIAAVWVNLEAQGGEVNLRFRVTIGVKAVSGSNLVNISMRDGEVVGVDRNESLAECDMGGCLAEGVLEERLVEALDRPAVRIDSVAAYIAD